jgi:hypothetical protein
MRRRAVPSLPAIIEQSGQRKNQRLTMPVPAIGGGESEGEGVAGDDEARRRAPLLSRFVSRGRHQARPRHHKDNYVS